MSFKSGSVAIYRQLIEYFELEIASKRLGAGERVDSIRDLALQFKVNPNTVQKALSELERDHLIETDRTNGKFVTQDEKRIQVLQHEIGKRLSLTYANSCKSMGITIEESKELLEEAWGSESE